MSETLRVTDHGHTGRWRRLFLTVVLLAFAGGTAARASTAMAPLDWPSDPSATLDLLATAPSVRATAALLAAAQTRGVKAVSSHGDVMAAVATTVAILDRPPTTQPPAPERGDLAHAILSAANLTGAPARYLWRTALRESGLNPSAASPTSTARGLFQFTEATWLALLERHHPLAVRGPRSRARLLAQRYDPRVAARMAGHLARENAGHLKRALAHPPSEGDLYVAHFLGAADAVRLIAAARQTPGFPAARLLPSAARANQSVFYDGSRPRGCAEVLERLRHG